MADTGGRKRSGKFESPLSSGLRKRARGAVADDSFNLKSTNGNGTKLASTKHGKSQSTSSSDLLMVDRLVDVITRFNLYLNELFQLKEYGSLVEWNPSDFSFATNNQLPEIFQYFVDLHNYKLIWKTGIVFHCVCKRRNFKNEKRNFERNIRSWTLFLNAVDSVNMTF